MKFCNVPYPYEEFEAHFKAFDIVRQYEYIDGKDKIVHIGNDRSFEANMLRVLDYMCQHNSKDVAKQKTVAFCQIVHYLSEHISEFDTGKYAVTGKANEGRSLVAEHLLRAVHYSIMNATEEESRGYGPSPEKVMKLADTMLNEKS